MQLLNQIMLSSSRIRKNVSFWAAVREESSSLTTQDFCSKQPPRHFGPTKWHPAYAWRYGKSER